MKQSPKTSMGHSWGAHALVSFTLILAGCSDAEPPPLSMPCPTELDGVCYGVDGTPICEDAFCTSGSTCGEPLSCATVVTANDDGQLAAALTTAAPGSCVALAPGSYGAVVLPAGVSLLGKGAGDVTLAGVTLQAGQDAVVRGVTVGVAGIDLADATNVCVDRVHVAGSAANGVSMQPNASATLASSTISSSGSYGVLVGDGASVSIDGSAVIDSGGPGLRAQCAAGCGCTARPNVSLTRSLFQANRQVGVAVAATDVSIEDVAIVETDQLDGKHGGGFVASACSSLAVEALAVDVKDDLPYGNGFGVLVDSSTGVLGGGGEANGIIVVDGRPAIWVMNSEGLDPTNGTLTIDSVTLQNNLGVGLGIGGGAVGIIVVDGKIANTGITSAIESDGGATVDVGYGMLWSEQAQVSVTGLALSASALQSVLVDGVAGAGSRLSQLQLSGGDELNGVLQQNVSMGDMSLDTSNAGVMFAQSSTLVFGIPVAPQAP